MKLRIIYIVWFMVFNIVTIRSAKLPSSSAWKEAPSSWTVEAEDPLSTVTWDNGTADIFAPKGLTLWYNRVMHDNTTIDYDAQIVSDKRFKDEDGNIRVSDLNCFWMADNALIGIKSRGGKFLNSYTMSLYYMGYGGNWNTTTRFRRYDGDARGVTDAQYRPRILKEYTDKDHLLMPDHWYHIHLEQKDGNVIYVIDGDTLVNYLDPHPFIKGYFGFRTTLSHAQLKNFRYSCYNPDEEPVVLHWIGAEKNYSDTPVTFGVPFENGEKADDSYTLTTADGRSIPFDTWRLASWPDGSAKWQAFAAVIPSNSDSCLLMSSSKASKSSISSKSSKSSISSKTRKYKSSGTCNSASPLDFTVTLNSKPCRLLRTSLEQNGNVRTTWRYDFDHAIVRSYHYKGCNQVKLVHTLLVDSALNRNGLHELSLHFKVPMHGKAYERYVQFDDGRPMSVQPLIARRKIDLDRMDKVTQDMLANIAKWDGFRLSQLSPNGYSIRKRTTSQSPWIGTIEGHRSNGIIAVGDSTSFTSFRLEDFWQSYPSTLQVDNARSDSAIVTISLYSPEAEPYSFAHYDTIPHGLEASYEDVQPEMSTAWGISRTSSIVIENGGTKGNLLLPFTYCLLPTPAYLHRKHAFGIWSLPTVTDHRDSVIESTIAGIMSMYEQEIERNGWYGFFNYGDVMHSYDDTRREWRYDVGGFAWDNTELGSPAMLWYQFLRTGDPRVWTMATVMTRHCSEVDTYHFGPHAGLGSRHNVTHWGCGAKEARISEAWWNRFMYYLTADERLGDIMHSVADADTLLYTLDPMRLAQPRNQYPCTAPARLRLGPDWFAYASNWQTETERSSQLNDSNNELRTKNNALRKLFAGMQSIASFTHGFFEGPKALGYDPATGIITNECDSSVQNTNHLMTIMGGFELMNEIEEFYSNGRGSVRQTLTKDDFLSAFFQTWLSFCATYKQKAWQLSKNKFRIPRLQAYAAWRLGDSHLAADAWKDLLGHIPAYHLDQPVSSDPSSTQQGAVTQPRTSVTNDCATWVMDAIFMKEVLRNK